MKRVVIVLVAVGLVWVATTPELSDRIEAVRCSVVHVENVGVCEGSGFVIAPGIVCTARHVVEGGSEFVITADDGTEYVVLDTVISEKHDLAFMRIIPGLPHLRLAPVPRAGEAVFIMGSPYGYDNFNSVSLGIVAAAERSFPGWTVLFQTTSPASPGNSGGPVFDIKGRVVGVLVSGYESTLNYAVPTSVIDLEAVRGAFDAVRAGVRRPVVELRYADVRRVL